MNEFKLILSDGKEFDAINASYTYRSNDTARVLGVALTAGTAIADLESKLNDSNTHEITIRRDGVVKLKVKSTQYSISNEFDQDGTDRLIINFNITEVLV